MNVGNSVRKAIDDWGMGEPDAAMLHACNAIDGTAGKLYPADGSNARFTRFLRENYRHPRPDGNAGHSALSETQVPSAGATAKGRRREAGPGRRYLRNSSLHARTWRRAARGFRAAPRCRGAGATGAGFIVEQGCIRLSDRIVFGLLAVAVLSPANIDQRVPDSYFLSFGDRRLVINSGVGEQRSFQRLPPRSHSRA